jgi:hypothetical protein
LQSQAEGLIEMNWKSAIHVHEQTTAAMNGNPIPACVGGPETR